MPSSSPTNRPELLHELRHHSASFEGANASYFAIDVEPEGDYAAVRAQLDEAVFWLSASARTQGTISESPRVARRSLSRASKIS